MVVFVFLTYKMKKNKKVAEKNGKKLKIFLSFMYWFDF